MFYISFSLLFEKSESTLHPALLPPDSVPPVLGQAAAGPHLPLEGGVQGSRQEGRGFAEINIARSYLQMHASAGTEISVVACICGVDLIRRCS